MNALCLLSLLFAIPALAVKTAAPADPLEMLVIGRESPPYAEFDEDCDGKLEAEERTALVQRLLQDFDFNGDKAIDEREALLIQALNLSSANDYDANRNGHWERNEVETLLAELRAVGDTDYDGELSLAELRETVGLATFLATNQGVDWILPKVWSEAEAFPEANQKLLDPENWRQCLRLLEKHYESVNHGRTDLADLERESRCLISSVLLTEFWPEHDLDRDGHWDRVERARLEKDFSEVLDLNGDGRVAPEEWQEVGLRLAFRHSLDSKASKEVQRQWLTPASRREFDAVYLAAHDLNQNGKWEPEELEGGRGWERLLKRIFHDMPKFDLDGDQTMSPPERAALIAWVIEHRDAGADGRLDPKKKGISSFEVVVLRRPLSEAERARLLTACDLNGNGRLENGEAGIARFYMISTWIKKGGDKVAKRCRELLAAEADRNHDGEIDAQEDKRFTLQEFDWKNLVEFFPEADADKDKMLSLQERQVLLQGPLKPYDLNGNGRLELYELKALVTTGRRTIDIAHEMFYNGFPMDPEQPPKGLAASLRVYQAALSLGDGDGDGRFDAEERLTLINLCIFLARQPEAAAACKKVDVPAIRAFLDQALRRYDADRDGHLNYQELQTGTMLEAALLGFVDSEEEDGNEAAARELDRNGDGVIAEDEWPAYLASLRPDYDKNGNGRIEPSELQVKVDFEDSLLENLDQFQIPRNAAGRMDAAGRRELLARLEKRYDLNGDGRVDAGELETKYAGDELLQVIGFLYPGFESKLGDKLPEAKRQGLETLLLKEYDANRNGRLDPLELKTLKDKLYSQAEEAQTKFFQRQEQEQELAEALKRYDLNGNGQLDPDEAARAKQEKEAEILAPALEE